MAGADFERLDVYKAAIEFVITADALVERLPAGRTYLTDQLRRAATSIALNIAEGTGEFSPPDKARFYRMARRSGYECISVLDILAGLKLADTTELTRGKGLLDRIGAMLTRMIASVQQQPGTGSVRESPPTSAGYPDELPRSGSDSDSDSDSENESPALD